jgi:ABC-type phosphate transport system auxiliary subunit
LLLLVQVLRIALHKVLILTIHQLFMLVVVQVQLVEQFWPEPVIQVVQGIVQDTVVVVLVVINQPVVQEQRHQREQELQAP